MRKQFIIIALIVLSGLVACNKNNRSIESGQNVLVKSSDSEANEPPVDNSDSENSDGDIVFTCTESACKCGNVTLAKDEECIRNMPTCHHQRFPGKGFVCQNDEWVCKNKECQVNGTKVPTGTTPEGICINEQCQCGNTTIQQYMACKDQVVYCGHKPAPGNDFECDQTELQWLCKNDLCEVNGKKIARGLVSVDNKDEVYKCILPSCTVNGVEYENQNTISDEDPDYALHCNDKNCLLLLGSGCGMGTCSGTDDKWFYSLLTTKDDVCWNDSCACGQGTCGKYSICKNNQCVCANKEFPTTHGGDVCVAEITFSKYTYNDDTNYDYTNYDYTYWSSENSNR